MNCVLLVIVLCLCSKYTYGVIYHLNESEYSRMPPIYSMDDYNLCMQDPEGVFCIYIADLYSDTPSPLLDMIREYSEDTAKHFNHSRLHYATCVTRTCQHLHKDAKQDPRVTLEECLNEHLWNKYQLKARVADDAKCLKPDSLDSKITNMDAFVALCIFILLAFSFVATLYDLCSSREELQGTKIFKYFSIRQNWKRLMAAPNNPDARLDKMNSFYGIRSITTMAVLLVHYGISVILFIDNPDYVENSYNNLAYYILYNGFSVMQTHFFISGLLLTYNVQMYEERHSLSWKHIPMNIFLRWLRFTIPYALAIAVTSTWLRFAGSGTLWEIFMAKEIQDCQKTWWRHFLYINNYYDDSSCYQQTWFLAVDMHLFILGSITCVACRTMRSRIIVVSCLALLGVIIPAAHIYFEDMDAIVIMSPAVNKEYMMTSQSYNILHRRTHTNLIGYATGMTFGYFIYHLEKNNFNPKKYRKYLPLYWALVPAGFGLVILGSIFYHDGPRHTLLFRTLYGAMNKPVFTILMAFVLTGFIFKVENVYRNVVEWSGWLVPSRLGYSVFLLHVGVLKIICCMNFSLSTASVFTFIQNSLVFILISYLVALVFWLLVESPLSQLLRLMKSKMKREPEKYDQIKNNGAENKTVHFENRIKQE